jgi:hypothetical protein
MGRWQFAREFKIEVVRQPRTAGSWPRARVGSLNPFACRSALKIDSNADQVGSSRIKRLQ